MAIQEHKMVQAIDRGMNPGMALRVESSTINAFKRSMQDFFPHYVYSDMMLPTT